jgi:hypothetical protein
MLSSLRTGSRRDRWRRVIAHRFQCRRQGLLVLVGRVHDPRTYAHHGDGDRRHLRSDALPDGVTDNGADDGESNDLDVHLSGSFLGDQ